MPRMPFSRAHGEGSLLMAESPQNGSSLTAFDVEKAIRDWRGELAGQGSLRLADLDELEGHLRDELDALAQVGLEGHDAFVHAVSKLGASNALDDQFARGNPLFAWRLPGLLFLAGVLVRLLGDAVRGVADASFHLLGTTLELGEVAGKIAQVVVTVVPPLLVILGVVRFAPKLVPGSATRPTPHASTRRDRVLRIGFVLAFGVFVFLANFVPFPSSIHRLDGERLRILNSWYAIAAPTYRFVWRVLPFVLVLVLIVTRRLAMGGRSEKRAAFWMLTGLLGGELYSNAWSSTGMLTLRANLSGGLPVAADRVAWILGIGVPALLLFAGLALWRRLPPPNVVLSSRRTDAVVTLLAIACLLATFQSISGHRVRNLIRCSSRQPGMPEACLRQPSTLRRRRSLRLSCGAFVPCSPRARSLSTSVACISRMSYPLVPDTSLLRRTSVPEAPSTTASRPRR